jgi:hypothetical protein
MNESFFTQESMQAMDAQVVEILLDEIDLAKPDDLAFLEFQVQRIASRIVGRIYSLCVALDKRAVARS